MAGNSLRFAVLGSGSSGNCTLVEAGKTRILIDAGFSGKEICRRLDLLGCAMESLSALLITHEHADHIAGVGVVARRCGLPVYANPATHEAASPRIKKLPCYREFTTGEPFEIEGLCIHPFPISHDVADPVGFTIGHNDCTLGYCTDTGKITKLISHRLGCCQALVLEANHDPQMLRDGPYPLPLQQRIRSSQGHLANSDSGRFLRTLAGGLLRQVVLAHLSETNNQPDLALRTVRQELGTVHCPPALAFASQNHPTQFFTLPVSSGE